MGVAYFLPRMPLAPFPSQEKFVADVPFAVSKKISPHPNNNKDFFFKKKKCPFKQKGRGKKLLKIRTRQLKILCVVIMKRGKGEEKGA